MSSSAAASTPKYSYPKSKIRVLLLENIHQSAVALFEKETFQVELLKGSLTGDELKAKVAKAHFIGVRSRTHLTREILEAAPRLLAVGCFCIGTNQVDLEAAAELGIAVFNSPFCNSRSVAELIISHIVALYRKIADKVREMHAGRWAKSADACHEVRGKTLGIVGYGHVGSQVSVLAEAMGMRVIFYDIEARMPLGNAESRAALDDVLAEADVVTLHVPLTDATKNMMCAPQFAKMRRGAYFINYSRGTVVDLDALSAALCSGALGGAAVDVFPTEPKKSTADDFQCVLQGAPNTILTPHIGGSTQEAQAAIADEVANALIRFCNEGTSLGAVNYPQLRVEQLPNTHRVLNVHHNVAGVLRAINNITADFNVSSQTLRTRGAIGYVIVDVETSDSHDLEAAISSNSTFPHSIKTRLLY